MDATAKIEGLPVSGYRPQSAEAVQTVNGLKNLEEHVLRLLDEVQGDRALAADPRWLAIGRTQIEQGFMAVNRSVFKPARVELRERDETSWLLERADSSPASPLYFAGGAGHDPLWTTHSEAALRLARREDGEQLAMSLGVECRIAEHSWG